MLVARNGVIVFERYKGFVQPGKPEPITDTTPLHVASISKTFTAMAVLKLAEDSLLNLNDSIQKFFPEFPYRGVTVKTLLNHRSGLPNYAYFLEDLQWDKSRFISNREILDVMIREKENIKDVRTADTHFSYCNTNYALLALLIEKVSGKSYAEYLNHHFFIPLQMHHTKVFTLADSNRLPRSYDWRGSPIKLDFLDQVYGDKNIRTTVRDLLQWDRGLNCGKLFKQESLDLAYTPYSNERPGIKNYGLGWRLNVYPDGRKMIFHNGWWHGSNAAYIRLPDENITIIVIGNQFTRRVYQAHKLAEILGKEKYPSDGSQISSSEEAGSGS